MAEHAGDFARQRTVNVFHNAKVGGKKDVEVALVDLSREGLRRFVSQRKQYRVMTGVGERDVVGG